MHVHRFDLGTKAATARKMPDGEKRAHTDHDAVLLGEEATERRGSQRRPIVMPTKLNRRNVAVAIVAEVVATLLAAALVVAGRAYVREAHSPRLAPVPSGVMPTATGLYCGELVQGGAEGAVYLDDNSPLDAETCFATAFSTCADAELTVVTRGVDTGNTDDLSITGAPTHCRIVDHQSWFVNVGPQQHKTTHCEAAAFDEKGLTLTSCERGDWTLAIPANQPRYPRRKPVIPSNTGIAGRVNILECPSASAASAQCRTDPAFGVTIDVKQDGATVASVDTGLQGLYRVPLPAGDYTVSVEPSTYFQRATPRHAIVVAGTVAAADFVVEYAESGTSG